MIHRDIIKENKACNIKERGRVIKGCMRKTVSFNPCTNVGWMTTAVEKGQAVVFSAKISTGKYALLSTLIFSPEELNATSKFEKVNATS